MGWNAGWVSAGIAGAVAGAALLGFLWRAWRPILGAFSVLVRPFTISKKIDLILNELGTNGGTSLRDAINRMEAEQTRTTGLVMGLVDSDKRPMFESDAAGAYIWVNLAYLSLTGRDRAAVMNAGWINVVHPDDRNDIWGKWNAAVAQKRAFEEEYRIMDNDGNVHRLICYAYPSFGRGGAMTGFFAHLEYLWMERNGEKD